MSKYKVEMFTNELELIRDVKLRGIVKLGLLSAPDYFFSVPAASSGKYHPDFAQGVGGLVKHTKAAVKIAQTLLVMEQYSHINQDDVISALILHDTIKKGVIEQEYTVFEHPMLASAHLYTTYFETINNVVDIDPSFSERIEDICKMIESHMGQWNTSKYSDTILPKPITSEQKFVHLCDYIASRKFLDLEFDESMNLI